MHCENGLQLEPPIWRIGEAIFFAEWCNWREPQDECSLVFVRFLRHSYLLFPLVLLLDAALACRENRGVQEGHRRLNVGDKVAEGVVVCLRAVLEKCTCKSVSRMLTLIGKLTRAALLTPAEASEEFRHGIVLCLRSVFQAL